MGVHGLWRLVDASGKPVPLETLEGKVLAIDVSIWIHQVLQGYQDRRGSAIPNSHLLGLFHRICKLLYFKIKPVFVFDGGVPMLKKNTIASRKKQKAIAATKAQQIKADLIQNLIKHAAVKGVLGKEGSSQGSSSSAKATEDLFKLPDIPSLNSSQSDETIDDYDDYDSDDSVELSPRKQAKWKGNIHNVDVTSDEFKALPADVRFDVLTDLKETRKQNSWGRLHEMPGESHQFSDFQMKRLLKRRKVQESLESAEKEMGGRTMTLEELEKLLTDQGIDTRGHDEAFRIASDSNTRVVYINNPKSVPTSSSEEFTNTQNCSQDLDLQSVSQFSRDSGNDDPSIMTTPSESVIENINEYALDSDWESEDEAMMPIKSIESSPLVTKKYFGKQGLNPAVTYMLEYSGLPQEQILALIEKDKQKIRSKKVLDFDESNKNKNANDLIISLLSPEKKFVKNTEENNKSNFSKSFTGADDLVDLTEISDTVEKTEHVKANEKFPSESVIENINEYALDSDWESDDEAMMTTKSIEPSQLLTKKHFGKQGLNPAVAYMLEYSGLPQDQILALIEGDKQKMRGKKVLDFDENNMNKNANDVIISMLSTEKKTVNNIEENNKPSFSKSFTGAVDFTEICNTVEKIQQVKVNEKLAVKPNVTDNSALPKIISSDSDTDSDLVDVQDVPIPESNFELEILVKSDEALKDEDDIFADIFTKESADISDVNTQDLSSSQNSITNTSFGEIEEISSTSKEIEKSPIFSQQPEQPIIPTKEPISPTIDQSMTTKSQTEIAPSMDTASANLFSKPSTSRAQNLSDQVARFKPELLKANQEKLATMQAELESEHGELTQNIGKLERQATAVTDQMRLEAQELLRLFGIPYIVAPMEAEAQCAYLESIEITDGTVTDDSDIWLFGGRCVYKNFFNNNKRVMQYKLSDIQHHFKLSRQQMIQLALLVGSDYTVGVSGIGPVTALEVLAAFPSEGENLLNGLSKFSSWIKTGRSAGPGRATLRSKLRNVAIDKGFPSEAVVQAYLFPKVDESKETFTWSKPNLTLLADYTRQKFGWTRLKFEETIGPVVKKLAEARTQNNLLSYFRVNTVPKSIETNMSKRVKKAVERLGNGAIAEDSHEDDNLEEATISGKSKEIKKRRGKGKKSKNQAVESGFFSEEITGKEANNPEVMSVGSEAAGSAEIQMVKVAGTSAPRIPKNVDDFIPQREKDKANSLKKKLKAIEVFRKSKKGPGRTKKAKRVVQNITKEAKLSESSDSS